MFSQLIGQQAALVGEVDRAKDRAGLPAGEHQLGGEEAVGREDGDPIALADPEAREVARDPVGDRAELLIGELRVRLTVVQADGARTFDRPVVESLEQRRAVRGEERGEFSD